MANIIEGYLGKRVDGTKSHMPARLDKWQSITGLILALFIIGHMFFTSSILLGKDVMSIETGIFEGSLFFDQGHPIIVSIAATIIFIIFVIHAGLAMRKFPYKWKEYKILKTHAFSLRHTDTYLWMAQATTGFIMFFLGSVHLWQMMTIPDKIGPFASADRIYSDNAGLLYALLLLTVISHAMIGLYRLSVKWGIPSSSDPRALRRKSKKLMWLAIVLLSLMGYSALITYWNIGHKHSNHYGERYHSAKTIQTQGGNR